MTMEMTAAEYGKLAVGIRHHDIGIAQMYATLALAAATLETAEANYEAHKRRLLEALNEEAKDPSEADQVRFEEALKDGTDNCPGCGCAPNVLGPDGVWVCEEYPGCSALMGPTTEDQARLDAPMPKPSFYCPYEWSNGEQTSSSKKWGRIHSVDSPHRCVYVADHEGENYPHRCACGSEL